MELVSRIKKRLRKENLNLVDFNIPKSSNCDKVSLDDLLLNDYDSVKKHVLKEIPYIRELYYGRIKGSFKMRKLIAKSVIANIIL